MANNDRRDFIVKLLKIGAEYLLPIAKEAFYEYRDRILEAHKVSDEERAILIDWIFEGEPKPAPPVEPPPEPVDNYLTKFPAPVPDDAELLSVTYGFLVGDQVCAESVDSEWMVVQKGASRLGAKLLRVIGG